MDIEIAKMERMAQTGSSLLRLIQNSHTPALDLLVREAIQNSLDASANPSQPVDFDITINRFWNESMARHFDGIENKLLDRYSDIESAIVLRDSNTVGLTGPIHQDEVVDNEFGNLLKLVYEISMPQEKKEAGGSWGLGKTVYFRIGIGLVVYYSRIKLADGSYQSRLAACLIEDESSDKAIIPPLGKNKRGIAWWGQLHKGESTKPITDEEFISSFLADFNIEPYEEDKTGTTVIIPYINKDELLIEPERLDAENNKPVPYWYAEIEKYLNLAIQRWYAPRIDNPGYKHGSYLRPSINRMSITKQKMEPMFRIVRGLYNYAETDEKDEIIDSKNLRSEEVVVYRDMESNIAGKVAYIKVNSEALQMLPPYNKWSPYEYIDEHSYSETETNVAIISYVRKPGMIINYEVDSKWTQGIEETGEEEYIIGIFVPASNNIVKLSNISLDEYLRQGEKADHSSWQDTNYLDKRYTIVERIQKRTAQTIKKAFNKKEEKVEGTRSGALSAKLASSLLPPVGFGKAANPRPKGSTGNNSTDVKRGSFNILSSRISGDKIVLTTEITPRKHHSKITIETLVASEGNRKIRGDIWEKDIGTRFPVEIFNVKLDDENISIEYSQTSIFSVNNKIHMILLEELSSYEVEITLLVTEALIQPDIISEFSDGVIANE